MNKLRRWFGLPEKMTAQMSVCNKYYYIVDLVGSGHRMGWATTNFNSRDWYPFAFWKIKKGETRPATQDEIEHFRSFLSK